MHLTFALLSHLKHILQLKDGTSSLVQSKLHLVDLAGSERAARTQASGVRLKESVGINQVLTYYTYAITIHIGYILAYLYIGLY